ncbi:MAG: hypothetical protein GY730_10475 [bacterium]|nr:hypothetical protein [bacterium]
MELDFVYVGNGNRSDIETLPDLSEYYAEVYNTNKISSLIADYGDSLQKKMIHQKVLNESLLRDPILKDRLTNHFNDTSQPRDEMSRKFLNSETKTAYWDMYSFNIEKTTSYVFPDSYFNISKHSKSVLQTARYILKDYVDKSWIHWGRHNQPLARKIVSEIESRRIKNIEEINDYIMGYFLKKNDFFRTNNGGSFNKRLAFINMLNQQQMHPEQFKITRSLKPNRYLTNETLPHKHSSQYGPNRFLKR